MLDILVLLSPDYSIINSSSIVSNRNRYFFIFHIWIDPNKGMWVQPIDEEVGFSEKLIYKCSRLLVMIENRHNIVVVCSQERTNFCTYCLS